MNVGACAWWLVRWRLRRGRVLLIGGVNLVVVVLVLFGVGVNGALAVRAEREQARGGYGQRGDVGVSEAAIGRRTLTIINVWARADQPPVVDGLPRNPRPGEVFVSPALARALGSEHGPSIRPRLPGKPAGTLGEEVLVGPKEWVAAIGYDARAVPPPVEFGRILGVQPGSAGTSRMSALLLSASLILPTLALAAACARLDARRRSRQLATVVLLGASPRGIRSTIAIEGSIIAIPVAIVAVALAELLRNLIGTVPLTEVGLFTADLRPGAPAILAALAAGPILAIVSGLMGSRRLEISPLAVQRAKGAASPSRWRALPLVLGTGLLLAATARARDLAEPVLAATEAVSLVLVLVGVALIGPLAVDVVARVMLRLPTLSAGGLIAASRLRADAGSAFRVVSGLAVALFAFGFLSTIRPEAGGATMRSVADLEIHLGGHRAAAVLDALGDAPGVDGATPVGYQPLERPDGRLELTFVTTCDGLAVLAVQVASGNCESGEVFVHGDDAAELRALRHTGTLSGARIGGAQAAVIADIEQLLALDPPDIMVRTNGSSESTRNVVRVVANVAPMASIVDRRAPGEGAESARQAISLALSYTVVVAGFGLLVATVESLLERRRILSMLALLGLGFRSAVRIVALELGVPYMIATVPAVIGGASLALAVGSLLDAEIGLPLAEARLIAIVVAGLVLVSGCVLVAVISRSFDREVLRAD